MGGRHERIERTLRDAGWRVTALADREVGREGGEAVRGPSGYLLYVDQLLVGVIAAADPGDGGDPPTLLEQAGQHAMPARLTSHQSKTVWRPDQPLPFQFGTNGHRWLFRNLLDFPDADDARSRLVFAPPQPDTVRRWMREAGRTPQTPTLRSRLRLLPDHAIDPKKELYKAQRRSIKGLEDSLAKDKPRSLIQMATGAGKTFTVVVASQRLLKYAQAHRILFLVDRNNLGAQAYKEYDKYQLPDASGRPFTEAHPVTLLTGGQVPPSSKVVVSTIQRVWSMLSGQPTPEPSDASDAEDARQEDAPPPEATYNPRLPPEHFDFIVVDECHRSIYGRWLPVLKYFDAHVIGLTATPVLQTFGFFQGNLVSEYTREQAVADRVNVDYDVYRIRTRITEQGSTIPALTEFVHEDGTVERVNTTVAHIDRPTRAQRYVTLEQDDTYGEDELNRRVQSVDQIRTVIRAFRDKMFSEIFPDPSRGEWVPKTLIFAKDNLHADRIVEVVRQEFNAGDGFCKKITGEVPGAENLIQAFRNHTAMRIAVTVDMIATGTDVPALECLLFMRGIKTWSYFEQMKGRGSRTIKPETLRKITPDAGFKDRFVIVDAVGVTEGEKVDARPLIRDLNDNPATLERLLAQLAEGRPLSPDDASTLAGRLSRLSQRLTEAELAEIEGRAGGVPLSTLAGQLITASDPEGQRSVLGRSREELETDAPLEDEIPQELRLSRAAHPLASNGPLRELLLELSERSELRIDHLSEDDLIEARGMSKEELAERTIDSWKDFQTEHQDEIDALTAAFRSDTSPAKAVRHLKSLTRRIETPRRRWTLDHIWDAYMALGRAREKGRSLAGIPELAALLRHELGLDDEVTPYRETVERRYENWLARQEAAGVTFSDEEREWLELIVDVVANSVTVSQRSFKRGPLARKGGLTRFVNVFGDHRAKALIEELDRELWLEPA